MGIVTAVIAAAVAAGVGWLVARRSGEGEVRRLELELAALKGQLLARDEALRRSEVHAAALSVQEEQLSETLTVTRTELAVARARAADHEQGRAAMRLEFEALAQKLLDEKGRAMLDQSHRGLEGLLAPVKDRLKEFEEKFQKTYDQDNRDRGSLLEKLRGLQDAQNRLHADAQALSRALTGESKAQGDWGELVLESLLSTAGLTEGREYELQVDHRDEAGELGIGQGHG